MRCAAVYCVLMGVASPESCMPATRWVCFAVVAAAGPGGEGEFSRPRCCTATCDAGKGGGWDPVGSVWSLGMCWRQLGDKALEAATDAVSLANWFWGAAGTAGAGQWCKVGGATLVVATDGATKGLNPTQAGDAAADGGAVADAAVAA